MKAVWKISGDFYGWISEQGFFYSSKGKMHGTFQNNILYNQKGKYIGELVNENYIGFKKDREFLEGPECHFLDEVYLDSLPQQYPYPAIGYDNPE